MPRIALAPILAAGLLACGSPVLAHGPHQPPHQVYREIGAFIELVTDRGRKLQ